MKLGGKVAIITGAVRGKPRLSLATAVLMSTQVTRSGKLFCLLYQLYGKITNLAGVKVSRATAKGRWGFSFDYNRDPFNDQFSHLLVKIIHSESNVLNTLAFAV